MIRVHPVAVVFALLGIWCAMMPASGHAAAAGAGVAGSSGPAAASAPDQPTSAVVASCDLPTSPRPEGNGPISVTVNAATAWQPRGGEVLIEVKGDSTKFAGLSFKACFGWNNHQAGEYFAAENLRSVKWFEGFVQVRPSDQTGILNLGVIVPPLPLTKSSFYQRWASGERSTGLSFVPVADMRLIAYTKGAVLFDEVRPVGITSVTLALFVAAVGLAVAVMVLRRLATERQPPAQAETPTDKTNTKGNRIIIWLKAAASPDWILDLIRSSDGRASLSAFQVLLWTLVVAASAMYVMTLSGNLINITSGTLTLLGIAGAAGVLASFGTPSASPDRRTDSPPGTTGTAPAGAAAGDPAGARPAGLNDATGGAATSVVPVAPRWQDLIVDPATKMPDISRTQMLFFTVVSAAFVLVQVLNYYVIPDIPVGYQILIGISNSVYISRKFTGPS
jgi:hypothetical protein